MPDLALADFRSVHYQVRQDGDLVSSATVPLAILNVIMFTRLF